MIPNHLSREQIQAQTFTEFGSDRLTRLAHAVGVDDAEPLLRSFRRMARPWGDWPIGTHPRWYPSILSDDHAPFELSAAFSPKETELRYYFEAQGDPPTLASNMATSLARLDELSREQPVALQRWEAVKDLFITDAP